MSTPFKATELNEANRRKQGLVRMLFGLNACNGRTGPDAGMDFTNIRCRRSY